MLGPVHPVVPESLLDNFVPDSAQGRTLRTNFQPSERRPVLVTYSVQITVTSGENGMVQLISDASSTPTTVRSQISHGLTITGLLTGGTGIVTGTLTYLVPKGHYVRIQTTNTAGTPAFSLVAQTEMPL